MSTPCALLSPTVLDIAHLHLHAASTAGLLALAVLSRSQPADALPCPPAPLQCRPGVIIGIIMAGNANFTAQG